MTFLCADCISEAIRARALPKTLAPSLGYNLQTIFFALESTMFRFALPGLAVITLSLAGCASEPAAPANGVAAAAQQEKESGGMASLAQKAKNMISDASDATSQTADDTMDWVNEMYKSLSDRGLTSANNAGDWVAQDWNAINAWEYKVVNVDHKQIAENPEVLSEQLNENGKHRWECFHVSDVNSGTIFYMKRQKKSYLRNIPLKDMMKLIPLLDNDDG